MTNRHSRSATSPNPTRRLGVLALMLALVFAACGGSDDSAAESVDDATAGAPDTSSPNTSSPNAGAPDTDPQVAAEAPELNAGGITQGSVAIDGVDIEYVAVVPNDFSPGDDAPVLLAMPPGGQSFDLTLNVTSGTYATEALARGWVVVSPAAPDGELYFNGSERLIPGFIDWMQTWVGFEADQLHLAGISNGGISSFRVAANQPERFASMIVFPGFPRSDDDQAALAELAAIPIRMFVGETDTSWIPAMEDAQAALEGFGGDVALDIRAGEGHVMASLSDGQDIFDLLDSFRP